MSKDTFNRYEKKFILDQRTYEQLVEVLEAHMVWDVYNKENGFYTISNIYYDTVDDLLIKKSLSKPIYKEKLRLRAYGIPKLEDKVFLEIKKKYNGIVNKRRSAMTLSDAYKFVTTKTLEQLEPYHNAQVIYEIKQFLNQYDLKPSTYIAYDRKALFSDELRITFDTNIRSRRIDLGLEKGDFGRHLLEENQWLMEVKTVHALPLWFVKAMSTYQIKPASFSKFGKEYLTRTNTLKGEAISCLKPYLVQEAQAL